MYVNQHPNFGLGNFVMSTPAIQLIHQVTGKRVKVLFSIEFIKELYALWPIIELIDKPDGDMILCNSWVNQRIPDSTYQFIKVRDSLNVRAGEMLEPPTFAPKFKKREGDYCVIVRGWGNDQGKYKDAKDPGLGVYRTLSQYIDVPVVMIFGGKDVSSQAEMYDLFPGAELIQNNIREACRAVQHCKWMLTNDTGMYHIGGAYRVKQFVLWKRTNFAKNYNDNPNAHFAYTTEKSIEQIINEFKMFV